MAKRPKNQLPQILSDLNDKMKDERDKALAEVEEWKRECREAKAAKKAAHEALDAMVNVRDALARRLDQAEAMKNGVFSVADLSSGLWRTAHAVAQIHTSAGRADAALTFEAVATRANAITCGIIDAVNKTNPPIHDAATEFLEAWAAEKAGKR